MTSLRVWAPRQGDMGISPVVRPAGAKGRAILSLLTLAVQGVLRVAMGLLLAASLGLTKYGDFAAALALGTWLSIAWAASTGATLTRFAGALQGAGQFSRAGEFAAALSRRTLVASVMTGAISLCCSLLLGSSPPLALAAMALTTGISLQSLSRAANLLRGDYIREAAWGISTTAIGVGLAVALGVFYQSAAIALAALALGYLLYACGCLPRAPLGRRDPTSLSEASKYTTVVALGSLASAGFLQLGTISSAIGWSGLATGQYGLAVTLATPIAIAAAAGSMVINPAFARSAGARDSSAAFRLWWNSMVIYAVLLGVCTVTLSAFLWKFGEKFAVDQTSQSIVYILLAAVSVTAIASPSVSALNMSSSLHAKRIALFSWIGALVGMAAWVWAWAAGASVIAVAWGYLGGVAVTSFLCMLQALRVMKFNAI